MIDRDHDHRDDRTEFLEAGPQLLNGGRLVSKTWLRRVGIAAVILFGLGLFLGIMHLLSLLPQSRVEPAPAAQPPTVIVIEREK